jgi:crotonobetainyl-CoA:carnitine CoA-transferase CaiB-like acyl-CoA transferase
VFVPSGIFAVRDGAVAVVAGTDAEFQGLAAALGRPELAREARFETARSRRDAASADALDALIAAWCRERTREEVTSAARAHGFAAAPVMHGGDQYHDAHFRARGSVWETDDPVYGRVVDYGPAPKLSATPARHRWVGKPVGWHNDHVLKGVLGLSDDAVATLERAGVVGQWSDRLGAKPPDEWTGEASRP